MGKSKKERSSHDRETKRRSKRAVEEGDGGDDDYDDDNHIRHDSSTNVTRGINADDDSTRPSNPRRTRKKRSDDSSSGDQHRRRVKRRKDRKKRSRKRSRRNYSSSSSSSSSSESSSSDDSSHNSSVDGTASPNKTINKRLLAKLAARGETLEERKARRAQKRAALISAKFGYTTEENPFNDPNLHEKFTWKKKDEIKSTKIIGDSTGKKKEANTFEEIEKVRRRRQERELQREEMERIRAEESRMKELENYDDWAKKEEEFHLQQQRQRSAIRLVEGREKPVDVLAKNLLIFGLSESEKKNRTAVKYQEKYNAMDALETLEAELEEPHEMVKVLKLEELEELRRDIDAFRVLEREAAGLVTGSSNNFSNNSILQYWDALRLIVDDEIKYLQTGGVTGTHAAIVKEVQKIFEGQSTSDLCRMRHEVESKLRKNSQNVDFDHTYWQSVLEQLDVHLAKKTLSEQHAKMLVRQLEKLEQKRDELAEVSEKWESEHNASSREIGEEGNNPLSSVYDGGDLEQELGLTDEIALTSKTYSWQDKYRPRKPRYFNRVKTGYDWNKYNQTHYDKDNPPPKTVQGYKFNIFYTDLIDPTKTPTFRLEPADSDDFCIIRFTAGAPYEDIAFKIINREWNRSRKRGFKCTFDRGVLSLYFNFTTHWYRR